MGKGGGQVTGYNYYMGIHFGLSHGPLDEYLETRAGDLTAWTGSQAVSGDIAIDAPTLFGGSQREGGLQGTLSIMMGEATQGVNAYLLAKQGSPQPAYRGVASAVYQGGLVGANNPYPKPWAHRVRRALKGWLNDAPWYSAKAAITLSNGAVGMNPAHMVYEVITNSNWGMGYPAGQINDANFRAAADQLYSEGFGLCFFWNRQDTIESFLQTLMDYIAGVLVSSPTTGLFELNLIRGGYTVSALPHYTADDVVELQSKEDASITGCTNEMVIRYFDPTLKNTQSIILQALGAIQSQGVVVSSVKDYPGIATSDLAARVAQRELQAVTVPLKRLTAKFNRKPYQLVPGKLFVLTFPGANLNAVVFRVGEVDYGQLKSASITITAIQDVFSMPSDTYIVGQTSGWTIPAPDPVAPTVYVGNEPGYRDLLMMLGRSSVAALPAGAGFAAIFVARPNGLQYSYQVWSAPPPYSAFVNRALAHFTPSGTVQSNLDPFDTSCTFLNLTDAPLIAAGQAAMLIDGTSFEIIRIDAINTSTGVATIARGCCDSVAAPHVAGVRAWFFDLLRGTDNVQYTATEVVELKPLTNASNGTLVIGLAPTISVTVAGRAELPYPPALPKINGTRYDLVGGVTGAFTLSWIERNRVTEGETLTDQTAATITPEAGTTYTIRVIDTAGPTLLATFTGITGTSQLINAGASTTLSIELESVCNGLTSLQHWAIPVVFTNASVGITDESSVQITDESGVDIFSE